MRPKNYLHLLTNRRCVLRKCGIMVIYTVVLIAVLILREHLDTSSYKNSNHNTDIVSDESDANSEHMEMKLTHVQSESNVLRNEDTHIQYNEYFNDKYEHASLNHIQSVQSKKGRSHVNKSIPLKGNSNTGIQDNAYVKDRLEQIMSTSNPIQSATLVKGTSHQNHSSLKTTRKMYSFQETKEILSRVDTWFLIKNESEKDQLLNKHQFKFHLNSRLCVGRVDMLIFVHSAANHFKQREAIRKTWASVKYFRNLTIATVFMLGVITDDILQQSLTVESLKYGDIVQGNFIDSYKNLTYKHVMSLHWITSQCSDVRTVVKVDDDIMINMYKLISFSINVGHYHNNIYCAYFVRGKPIRNMSDKWYTPYEVYPFELYPNYCEGLAYIVSADEVKRLCKASEDTRFYWVDDMYVTGILARKTGIAHVHFALNHMYVKSNRISNIGFNDTMFFLEYSDWETIWSKIQMQRQSYE